MSVDVAKSKKRTVDALSMIKAISWIGGVVTIAVSATLWVQSQGDSKYYPKLSGESLEKQLSRMEQQFDNLEEGNKEIIRLLGRLEAERGK